MSTPPPNYPPPQGYYGAPPPQQNSGGGCLKAAGITCGVLILLAIIGGIMMANWVKNQAKNPSGLIAQSMKIGEAGKDGIKIQQAIVKYKSTTGSYPPSLAALVPKYLYATDLHSSLDPNSNPAHVSWTYVRPGGSSTGSTPMLILPYTMTISMMGQTQTQHSRLIINIDGTTSAGQTTSTGSGQSPFGGSSSSGAGSTSGGQ